MADVLHVYREVTLLQAQQEAGEAAPLMAILSYEEKPGIQGIGNTAPDLPPVAGSHSTVGRDQRVQAPRYPFPALRYRPPHRRVARTCGGQPSYREFVACLKDVDAHYPADWKVRVILNNHSAHISKQRDAEVPATVLNRFEFIFTPKHGSWLNLIDVFFSKLARRFRRGIRGTSKDALKERSEAYLAELNQTPVIFCWKYGLEEVA